LPHFISFFIRIIETRSSFWERKTEMCAKIK
jgi:hypothetical protein